MEKLNDKKILILIAAVVAILLIVVGVTALLKNKPSSPNPIKNNNPDVSNKENGDSEENFTPSDEAFNFDFHLEDTTYEDGTTGFVVTITNKSDQTKYLNEFFIQLEKNGESEEKETLRVYGVVDQELEPNGSTTITCSYGDDLSSYNIIGYSIEK